MQRILATYCFAAALLFAMSLPATAAPPRYSVLRIGQDIGAGMHGLNDLGQVAGTAFAGGVDFDAFLTQPNSPFNFSTDRIPGTDSGEGVNNAGQVVGGYRTPDGHTNAFRTRPGQPFDPAIDGLGGLGVFSTANAINAAGELTGWAASPDSAIRVGPGETVTFGSLLGTLGGSTSIGRDINDAGQIVGESRVAGTDFRHAFRTAPGADINPLTDDLGTLGGDESVALAISSGGRVVGYSQITPGSTDVHAFRTQPGQPINPLTDDLGTLGGTDCVANGINDAGWVVGASAIDPSKINLFHAFVYDGTALWDLNDLIETTRDISIHTAKDINNVGQIVASGFDAETGSTTYLLTPIPVPEPASISMLSTAAAVLSFAAFRSRKQLGRTGGIAAGASRGPSTGS